MGTTSEISQVETTDASESNSVIENVGLMNPVEITQIAWEGVMRNKVRSFLTMLGVIIGVAAVIIMISISAGTEATIAEQIEGLGANLAFIQGYRPECKCVFKKSAVGSPSDNDRFELSTGYSFVDIHQKENFFTIIKGILSAQSLNLHSREMRFQGLIYKRFFKRYGITNIDNSGNYTIFEIYGTKIHCKAS